MYDFGNSNGHTNRLMFGDLSELDAPTSYSAAFWIDWDDPGAGASEYYIFSKTTNTNGWHIRVSSAGSYKMEVVHYTGGAFTTVTADTVVGGTLECWVVTWNGTQIRLYQDSVEESSSPFAQTRAIGANTNRVCIANQDGQTRGFGGSVGHCMFWNGVVLTAGEVTQYYNGHIPQRDSLSFWTKCISFPGREEITDTTGILENTVTFISAAPPDNYYGVIPAQAPIQIAGIEQHRSRIPQRPYTVAAPLECIDYELGDDLQYKTREGLEPTGSGFGVGDSPKRLVRVTGATLQPRDRQVSLVVEDLSRWTVMFYDQFVAPYAIDDKQLGHFRLYPPGVTRTTVRASQMWVPQAGGTIIALFEDEEPITRDGLLIENEKTNDFTDSAFFGGVDGGDWTLVGEGVNGSAIDDDTTDLLFSSGITPQSCKLTNGDPSGAVGIRQAVTVAGGDEDKRKLLIDYKDDDSEPLSVVIQRDSDSNYRQSLIVDVWGAGIAYLDLPTSATATRYEDFLPITPAGGHGGIVYTVTIYAQTAASQVNHIYQAEFVNLRNHPTSRIVTPPSATYTREATDYQISNSNTKRTVRGTKGTIYFRTLPNWSSVDLFADNCYFLTIYHDASNDILLYWDNGDAAFHLDWKAGGSTYTSSIDTGLSWSRGDELKFAIRWLQSGDLGKTQREVQLFADFGAGWITGSLATPAADITEHNSSYIKIGSPVTPSDANGLADAYFKYFGSYPEPLHIDQIKALP